MIKIQDNFLFHMFQAILYIDYLRCLKLWEGWRRGIAELSQTSRKNTTFALRRRDHTFK